MITLLCKNSISDLAKITVFGLWVVEVTFIISVTNFWGQMSDVWIGYKNGEGGLLDFWGHMHSNVHVHAEVRLCMAQS